MMMACLNKSSTLPGAGEPGGGGPGQAGWVGQAARAGSGPQQQLGQAGRAGCGPQLQQLLLDQNKVIQVNLARSFWKGVGDIKVSRYLTLSFVGFILIRRQWKSLVFIYW
jgi:hypothetical protein